MSNNNNQDTLSVFTELLGLLDISVIEIRNSADDRRVTLVVASTKESLPCRICGKLTRNVKEFLIYGLIFTIPQKERNR